MHATSVTTVVLSVFLSLATAAGAVFVITGLFVETNGTTTSPTESQTTSQEAVAEADEPSKTDRTAPQESEEVRALLRRIDSLESQVDELYANHQRAARELVELRRAMAETPREGTVVVEADDDGEAEQWLAERLAAHPEVSALLESEEFEDAFRTTLEKIEEERRNQEIVERLENMERANERTYNRFLEAVTEQAGLTSTQRSGVETLLEERSQAMLRLYDPRIPREDRGNWREIHGSFEEQLQTILSPQQYQIYQDNGLGDMRQYHQRGGGGGGGGSND